MEHFSMGKYQSQSYVKKGKEGKYGINERTHIWKSLRSICWGEYLDLGGSQFVCLLLAK
jgi:hypothetical protein